MSNSVDPQQHSSTWRVRVGYHGRYARYRLERWNCGKIEILRDPRTTLMRTFLTRGLAQELADTLNMPE